MEVIFCQYKSYSISKSTVWQEWQSASINHVLPIDVIFCQYKWYFANKSYILQSCSVEICSLTVNFVLFCRSALLCRFNIPPNTSSWYQNIISSRATHWYDTRCYFNVRSKADISQLNLPHGISYFMLLLHDTMLKMTASDLVLQHLPCVLWLWFTETNCRTFSSPPWHLPEAPRWYDFSTATDLHHKTLQIHSHLLQSTSIVTGGSTQQASECSDKRYPLSVSIQLHKRAL